MYIFDRVHHITNRTGMTDCNESLLEMLDTLLNQFDIPHSFEYTYPDKQELCEAKGHEYCVSLVYRCEDEMQLDLVMCLWLTKYRNCDDSIIRRWWHRQALRYRHLDKQVLKPLDEEMEKRAEKYNA